MNDSVCEENEEGNGRRGKKNTNHRKSSSPISLVSRLVPDSLWGFRCQARIHWQKKEKQRKKKKRRSIRRKKKKASIISRGRRERKGEKKKSLPPLNFLRVVDRGGEGCLEDGGKGE